MPRSVLKKNVPFMGSYAYLQVSSYPANFCMSVLSFFSFFFLFFFFFFFFFFSVNDKSLIYVRLVLQTEQIWHKQITTEYSTHFFKRLTFTTILANSTDDILIFFFFFFFFFFFSFLFFSENRLIHFLRIVLRSQLQSIFCGMQEKNI